MRNDDFQVQFLPADTGWCDVELRAGECHFCIKGSAAFHDPYPQLIVWLEAVHREQQASMFFDEEGHVMTLHFQPLRPGWGRLQVIGSFEDRIWLDSEMTSSLLAGTFYRSLHSYAKLADYNPEEWESRTVGDYLERNTGLNQFSLPWQLAGLEAEALQEVIRKQGGPIDGPGFSAPSTWTTMTLYERMRWSAELLKEHEGPWDGAPLNRLTSKTLDDAYCPSQ